MNTTASKLMSVRFSEDLRLLKAIQADEHIATHLKRLGSLESRKSMRSRLLSCAVRVDVRLIPRIATAFEQVRKKTGMLEPMEAYVFDHPSVQASVMKGRSQTLVVLSSEAVNTLEDRELEFVIGHELGHAIFNHLDVAAANLIESEAVDPRSCLKLLAWQRAAEISADRCGLMCCGSLDIASTTLFKSISGLHLGELIIDSKAFAEQWEHLANAVIEEGGMEDIQVSHPFPPLRVKAMMAFWESTYFAETHSGTAQLQPQNTMDEQIAKWLAMLDPLSRESGDSADPILEDFFLWGGLYIAVANGEFHDAEQDRLSTMVSRTKLDNATQIATPDADYCRQKFKECIANRQQKIKSMEIHRILQGLLQVAISDGEIDAAETRALKQLGEELGIRPRACDLLISNMLNER